MDKRLMHWTLLGLGLAAGVPLAGMAAPIAGSAVTAHPAVASGERVGSDSWITTKVKLELVSDSDTRGFDIHVTTLHGVVKLRGRLPTEHDVERVCNVAGQVQGVRHVDSSELRIRRPG